MLFWFDGLRVWLLLVNSWVWLCIDLINLRRLFLLLCLCSGFVCFVVVWFVCCLLLCVVFCWFGFDAICCIMLGLVFVFVEL